MREAMVQSALLSAERAVEMGLPQNRIILSAKVSAVQDLIAVYIDLARRSNYAIHLGLTEAGMGSKGIVASSAALGILLQQGIGDTIRVSLTPEPGGDRTLEVKVAQEILQTMGFRVFVPLVAACPGCGRTTSTTFQELARDIQSFIHTSMPEWKTRYPGVEALNVAVMGCIVNGPGESKHADIGISLPGTGEAPAAPVFIDGKKAVTLRGPDRRRRLQGDGDRLHRAPLRHRRRRTHRGGVSCRSLPQGAKLGAAYSRMPPVGVAPYASGMSINDPNDPRCHTARVSSIRAWSRKSFRRTRQSRPRAGPVAALTASSSASRKALTASAASR